MKNLILCFLNLHDKMNSIFIHSQKNFVFSFCFQDESDMKRAAKNK